jgi:hypothetical protein
MVEAGVCRQRSQSAFRNRDVRDRTEIDNFTEVGIEIRVGAYGLAVAKKLCVGYFSIKGGVHDFAVRIDLKHDRHEVLVLNV